MAYLASRTLRAESEIFIADAGASAPLNNTFQTSLCVVSKNRCRVRGTTGLNSYMWRARRWQGKVRQKSITWTTSARLVFFSIIFLMHFCSIITSSEDTQSRPLLIHDAS